MYEKEKVYKLTLDYFNQDELAAQVWMDKYALKNKQGELLEISPKNSQERLIEEFTRIERTFKNPLRYKQIYNLITDFRYSIPAGSTLFGVGNKYSKTSLANCFCIGNQEDSYEGILQTDAEQVQLMKRRGGVGHDLSHIRPKGSLVKNAAITSAGIVPFMNRFSNSTNEVAQGGRRGALMLSLNVRHPDIEDFITSKDDLSKITGANISVKITDEFMNAIKNDSWHYMVFGNVTFPIDEISDEDLNSIPEGRLVTWVNCQVTKVKARKLWDKIIHQAWKSAEPGIIFWDNVIRESPADCYENFQSMSTNPCGEVPLSPYDSCRLLAINLYSMVNNPFENNATLDKNRIAEVAYKSQKILDDLVELEEEKIKDILEKILTDDNELTIEVKLWRKILKSLIQGRRTGLGFLGMSDMLAALNLKYDSEEAIKLTEEVTRIIAVNSYKSSIDMAKDRGAFPAWNLETEKNNPFIQRILSQLNKEYIKKYRRYGRRNIANLAEAPTGSLAILAQTTSGMEPLFQVHYNRRRRVDKSYLKTIIDKQGNYWEEYTVLHPKFKTWLNKVGTPGLMNIGDFNYDKVTSYVDGWEIKTGWDINNKSPKITNPSLEECIKHSPYHQSTAKEIDPQQKIKIQAGIQKWIDHSISVTYNLPEDATEKEVSNLYFEAWKQGLKGITIYRENSRAGILFNKKTFESHNAPKRTKTLKADISHPTIKGEQYLVLVGLMEDKPYEIFCFKKNGISLPKSLLEGHIQKTKSQEYNLLDRKQEVIIENITKYFKKPYEEFATRMISTALRHGADVNFIVEQLNKAEGQLFEYSKVMARVLKKYIKEGLIINGKQCPMCKNKNLRYENGCPTCTQCGYSKC